MPPEIVTAPPAPAAAAPAVTPPVVPAAPPTTSAAAPDTRKIAGNLMRLLSNPADDPTEPKPAPKKEDPKPEDKQPEPPKPAPKVEPKIKTPKAKEDLPPPVPSKKDLERKPADVPSPAPVPKAESDADFEKDLIEEEKALLDDARDAERHLPAKYKGHAAKMTAFLKENTKKLAALEKDEIDQEEYSKWHQANVPKIGPLDMRQIDRARVREDVTKEFTPKLDDERHARWVEDELPKAKQRGNEIYNKIANTALPDEVTAAIAERTKGITDPQERVAKIREVEADYALEFEIADNVIKAVTDDLEEFHRLTTVNPTTKRNLVAFDEGNVQHKRIVENMIPQLCNEFKETGGAELKKDGKWFVTRQEWADMDPSQRAPFWTFTNEQLAERAMGKVKGIIAATVKQQHENLGKRGFTRTLKVAAAPAPAEQPNPNPGSPPAPRPSPPPLNTGQLPATVGSRLAGKLANG